MKPESISAKEFINEQVKIAKKRGSKVRSSLNTPEGRVKIVISGPGTLPGPKPKRIGKSKYRNIKTVVDGITFDSKKEAKRYTELRMMEKAGEIENLEIQFKFNLSINKITVCAYVADFIYDKKNKVNIIEDVKSEITRKNPVYRIKKKLMKAIYDLDIAEV